MSQQGTSPAIPIWLRAIGVGSIALIGAAVCYAVAIGIVNFPRIGV